MVMYIGSVCGLKFDNTKLRYNNSKPERDNVESGMVVYCFEILKNLKEA